MISVAANLFNLSDRQTTMNLPYLSLRPSILRSILTKGAAYNMGKPRILPPHHEFARKRVYEELTPSWSFHPFLNPNNQKQIIPSDWQHQIIDVEGTRAELGRWRSTFIIESKDLNIIFSSFLRVLSSFEIPNDPTRRSSFCFPARLVHHTSATPSDRSFLYN